MSILSSVCYKEALKPIPVGGPFERIGVDVLQLTPTQNGNKYAVVFMDYLTKWPEVFAVPNQSAETIAELLVENLICRHGVPKSLTVELTSYLTLLQKSAI